MLAGKKHAPESLGRVLVLGLGKSGHDAVDYLMAQLGGRVAQLAVFGGQPNAASDAYAGKARDRGAIVEFGEGAVDRLAQACGGRFELCIASPGISEFSDLYRSAAAVSDEVISEVELAWRESDSSSTWVAVTGT